MRINPEELTEKLTIIDIIKNPSLYEEDTNRYQGKTTAGYGELRNLVDASSADVIIIDNFSDVFDGNESNRPQIRGFFRELIKLGDQKKIAVFLIDHINKATAKGDTDNETYSGSTAKHNSARSRLNLTNNHHTLTLRHQKSNHGVLSEDIRLMWYDGILQHQSSERIAADTAASEHAYRIAIFSLIDEQYKRGDFITPGPRSRPNAFKALKHERSFPKSIINSEQLFDILNRAENEGLLIREDYITESRNKKIRYKVIKSIEQEPLSDCPLKGSNLRIS